MYPLIEREREYALGSCIQRVCMCIEGEREYVLGSYIQRVCVYTLL